MKYEIGDFVSKPVTGICKIEDILYLTPQDEKNKKLASQNVLSKRQNVKRLNVNVKR